MPARYFVSPTLSLNGWGAWKSTRVPIQRKHGPIRPDSLSAQRGRRRAGSAERRGLPPHFSPARPCLVPSCSSLPTRSPSLPMTAFFCYLSPRWGSSFLLPPRFLPRAVLPSSKPKRKKKRKKNREIARSTHTHTHFPIPAPTGELLCAVCWSQEEAGWFVLPSLPPSVPLSLPSRFAPFTSQKSRPPLSPTPSLFLSLLPSSLSERRTDRSGREEGRHRRAKRVTLNICRSTCSIGLNNNTRWQKATWWDVGCWRNMSK